MNADTVKPQASTIFLTALMTLPLLMPGARRKYGTIPVALGIIGLGRQLYSWLQSRRNDPVRQLGRAAHDPDISRSPHLRTHLE